MLRLLSQVYARLGGSPRGRRVLRSLRIVALSRLWLRRVVLRAELRRPDDITVLIGVRNRGDYRITNALRSIRDQTYEGGAVRIIVVDYGSEPQSARFTSELCGRYEADYVRVDNDGIWSRARCLNVGLRRVDTKFVMTSDADILLSPRYLAAAAAALERAPLSVVCSPMLDLPEGSTPILKRAAESEGGVRCGELRELGVPRLDLDYHPSIAVTYSAFYRLIRGYDELYEGWGREDDDLMRRFMYLGLEPEVLESGSFYLHQWHPKFEGIPAEGRERMIEGNVARFRLFHSILRNRRGWGEAEGAAPASQDAVRA